MKDVNWIDLAQDREQWQALVNMMTDQFLQVDAKESLKVGQDRSFLIPSSSSLTVCYGVLTGTEMCGHSVRRVELQ